MTPRVHPGTRRDTGSLIWIFSRLAGRVTGTRPPAVFTTLGRGRGLFWGWLHFAGSLMPGGVLPRRLTELVILRVAHRRGSAYELAHHLRLGARVGLSAGELAQVQVDDLTGWPELERTLLSTTDALLSQRDLDDEQWTQVRRHLNERAAIELLLLVGHYDMLATTLSTLRIAPDE